MLMSLQIRHVFWFLCPSDPQSLPACHTIIWPMQTLTALHKACLMERSSWTASSTPSSLETHACRCGGQVPSRPGWMLSWECPCTSVHALKTSKVARYSTRPCQHLSDVHVDAVLKRGGALVFRCCWVWRMRIWSRVWASLTPSIAGNWD